MKILLCNKFYYRRGGDCIYTMNLEQLLKSHGHEVAIFSQQYPLNEPSPWSKYWPSEFKMKPSLNMIDSLLRPFGYGSVRKCFKAILNDFQPDVVHLNNIHTQLSPILAEIAHERGIRVIWTVHDSKFVCPCYTCMRDSKWCEECFTDKKAVIRHNCMPGGALGSFIGFKEAKKWTPTRLQNCTDIFICPSKFLAETLVKGGFSADRLKVISNFIDASKMGETQLSRDYYYVYLGQLNPIKGIKTLCEVASKLPYKLIVIGSGAMEKQLHAEYHNSKQIEFLGQLSWEALRPLVGKAKFMVLPSECSENNPISIIESLCLGTPVLGAKIGGIPELLGEFDGMTFQAMNKESLTEGINNMWAKQFDYHQISTEACKKYGNEQYYNTLLNLYNS